MQFAIAIPTDADSWRVVRRAEELGFGRAWFYDTQMLSADPFVAMAAAVKTSRASFSTSASEGREMYPIHVGARLLRSRIRRPHIKRNRKFVDSPLEEARFEPTVPPPGTAFFPAA
jgi:hypothetical protein